MGIEEMGGSDKRQWGREVCQRCLLRVSKGGVVGNGKCKGWKGLDGNCRGN
jgi:hypothetical protein